MKLRDRLLSGMLGTLLIFGGAGMCVSAANVTEIPATEVDSVYNLQAQSNTWEGWAQGPNIYSESGIVMDIDSGAILYAKNMDDQHYPASITKIMTALVVFENYKLDETVKFTWDDIRFLEYGDAHIGIKPDEELSVEDCLWGMLLASANEVSHGLGAHMEGGYDVFLQKMNEKARALGCKNSNWTNTHGLHDAEHYTSARDMALISRALFQYDKFREITNTYQHVIPATNITAEQRYVHQNHKMIRNWDFRYYEHCVGGKTGYTDQALSTLVTFATKDDVNLVAVVLRTHGGGNNAYADTKSMLDYAFNNFTKVSVTRDMIGDENIAKVAEGAYVMVPAGAAADKLKMNFTASEKEKDKSGTVAVTYEGQGVGTLKVTMTDDYYNELHGIKEEAVKEKKPENGSKIPLWLKIILIIIGVIGVLFIALVVFVVYKRKQIEKRRRKRRMEYKRQRGLR